MSATRPPRVRQRKTDAGPADAGPADAGSAEAGAVGAAAQRQPSGAGPRTAKARTSDATRDRGLRAETLRPGPAGLLAGLLAGAALTGFLILGGDAYAPSVEGLPDPGTLVGWGLPILLLAGQLAGVLTTGWLISAAFLAPQGRKGLVCAVGRADLIRAAKAAALWCVVSVVGIAFTVANVLGLPLGEALSPDTFATYVWAIPQNQAAALVALVAGAISVGALLTARLGSAGGWAVLALVGVAAPVLAGHSSSLGDHALAMTAGVAHSIAAAAWVGGLAATWVHAWRRDPGLAGSVARFSLLATWSIGLLAVSGVASAYTRLETPADLVTTGYGLLVTIKVALLGAIALLALRLRRRVLPALASSTGRGAFVRWAAVELGLLAVALGTAVALSRTAYPRVDVALPSPAEELLGFEFPPEPSWSTVPLGWHPDTLFLVGGLFAALIYVLGVRRLHRRGDRWPVGRTVAWLLGVGVAVWATNAGIAAYAMVSFGYHMIAHMMLAMMSPILLVLGAPVTLALRALRPSTSGTRGPREWLLWGLHTPVSRFVAHPLWALMVFTVGVYGLYFTSLFPTLMSGHIGHTAMQVHFLLAGFLFYWVVIGVDPGPRQVPHWARLLLVLISMVLHGFFAIALMMATTPVGAQWYSRVQPPWLDPMSDTFLGGGVAWAFGEIPTLVVLIALVAQWARSDERDSRRLDRTADRDGDAELNAYNAHLSRLADRDAQVAASERPVKPPAARRS